MISKLLLKPIHVLLMFFWLTGCTTGTRMPTVTSTLPSLPSATATVTATLAAKTPTPLVVSPTVEPTHGTPPGARLTINAQTQEAGVGSYCWMTTEGTSATDVCADFAGVLTARDPLVITGAPPYSAHFHLENPIPPDSLTLSMMPIRPDGEIPSADPSHRFWTPGNGWSAGLPLKTDVEFQFQEGGNVNNGDGLYLAELFAHWKNSGDVTYGFLIQLGAGNSGLSSQLLSVTSGPDAASASFILERRSPAAILGKGTASAMAISADGHRLGVITPLGAYLFDKDTQREIWFKTFENTPSKLAFSPDGSRLAVGSKASILSILDTGTGNTVLQIKGEEYIHAVWSPDDAKLLVSGGCQSISIWDAKNGALLRELVPALCNDVTPGIVDAVWSADGKRIYSGVSVWDASTYEPLNDYKPEMPEYVLSYALLPSPVDNLLAVGNGLSVAILDGETGKLQQTFAPEQQTVSSLGKMAWSPDGSQLCIGAYDRFFIGSIKTGQLTAGPKGFGVHEGLAWMPDGKTLLGLYSPDGRLNAVDITNGKIQFSLDGFDTTNFPTPYPEYPKWDGKALLTVEGNSLVRWDAQTGAVLSRTPAPTVPDLFSKYGHIIVLSPDGKRAVGNSIIMDAKTGQELVLIEPNPGNGWDIAAWSPDGKRLVSGVSSWVDAPVVWDAQTGKILRTLQVETSETQPYLGGLAWSPDGRLIIGGGSQIGPSGLDKGMLIVWDASSGKQLKRLTDGLSGQRINTIAWSPDGNWLAAGCASGKIILWDIRQNRPVEVLVGHADQVFGLIWSADSTMLASNAIDGTVLLWKLP